ncbi:hypothetical protein P3T35_007493 [Kitasatospora sp. GP30]|uniref:hypothetical protein n=1 Tax=Kitasatospora sp. GP30 TaxID=3035084 RepID=UPI000C703D07|nr:hypothetical protein [Kitasatospora sp. GP30]MDH6145438.1 hypothetical protein [Kitasatospora sp. GP30]
MAEQQATAAASGNLPSVGSGTTITVPVIARTLHQYAADLQHGAGVALDTQVKNALNSMATDARVMAADADAHDGDSVHRESHQLFDIDAQTLAKVCGSAASA